MYYDQGIVDYRLLLAKFINLKVMQLNSYFRPCKYLFSTTVKPVLNVYSKIDKGAQWLSGRVLGSRLKGPGFEPHLSSLCCGP